MAERVEFELAEDFVNCSAAWWGKADAVALKRADIGTVTGALKPANALRKGMAEEALLNPHATI